MVYQQKEAHSRFAELRYAVNETLRRCALSSVAPLVPLKSDLEIQMGAQLAPTLAKDALVRPKGSLWT